MFAMLQDPDLGDWVEECVENLQARFLRVGGQ